MSAAANTSRQRRKSRSARARTEADSDKEYQAYNARLQQASAARARLQKGRPYPSSQDTGCQAKQARDRHRAALAAAYEATLDQTIARIQTSLSKLTDLRSALLTRHLRHLRHAMDRRDATVAQISRRLAEHQKRVLTMAARLDALYKDRADAAAVMREEVASLENAAVGGDEGGRIWGRLSGVALFYGVGYIPSCEKLQEVSRIYRRKNTRDCSNPKSILVR
ncbi:hypothetical protein VTJ04DRAFT_3636 [Mycothermus thermophilus]|uniref:uncharacterized protein n=1 Tax=Humicola insolens TaxID=85995 RepID=UPI0037438F2E